MALDFYLADTANHLILGTLQPRLSLPDDGLTAILAALHEFTGPSTAHGGPTLDEYGTNVFGKADLSRLRTSLRRAASQFSTGPQTLLVWVGREVLPVERNVYQEVTRREILMVVAAIQSVVDEALAAGAWLFAVGD
jgi:hypothetical protein